jgi:uncharacterized membrane protein
MGLLGKIRNSFITGLILLLPLLITVYVLWFLVNLALGFIDPVVQTTNLSSYTANVEAVARVIAVVLIVTTIALIGYLAQLRLFRQLFGGLGKAVTIIPLFRTIYGTVRQLSTSFTTTENSFDKLVLIEFPRKGIYSIGLVTDESPRPIKDVVGKNTRSIYLPSSPNPTSGRLVLVPEDQVHEVNMSVRKGMRMLMTTGIGGAPEEELPLEDEDFFEEALDETAVASRPAADEDRVEYDADEEESDNEDEDRRE